MIIIYLYHLAHYNNSLNGHLSQFADLVARVGGPHAAGHIQDQHVSGGQLLAYKGEVWRGVGHHPGWVGRSEVCVLSQHLTPAYTEIRTFWYYPSEHQGNFYGWDKLPE